MELVIAFLPLLFLAHCGHGVGPPAYLSVPQFKQCLGSHTPLGASHREVCVPPSRPGQCPPSSWNSLVTDQLLSPCGSNYQPPERPRPQVIGGIGGRPPAYFSVPQFKMCLGSHMLAGASHREVCIPNSRPGQCPPSSWDRLAADQGIAPCGPNYQPPEERGFVGGVGAPAYLSVPNFRFCLGKHTPAGASHTELCVPRRTPDQCPPNSWTSLVNDRTLAPCTSNNYVPPESPSVVVGGDGGLPPAYLSVPEFDSCLAEESMPGQSHRSVCVPSAKPIRCPPGSWTRLTRDRTLSRCAC